MSLLGSVIGIGIVGLTTAAIATGLSQGAKQRSVERVREGAGSLRAALVEEIGAFAEDAYRRVDCGNWERWAAGRARQMGLLATRPFHLTRQAPTGVRPVDACKAPRYPVSLGAGALDLCLLLKADARPAVTSDFLRRRDALVVLSASAVDPVTGVPQGCGAGVRRNSVLLEVSASIHWEGGRDRFRTSFMVTP